MCIFRNEDYRTLVVFAKRAGQEEGSICLSGERGDEVCAAMENDLYRLIRLSLQEQSSYRLETRGVKICQMYLTDCPELLERGIQFLNPDTGEAVNLAAWYDTAVREQYHFAPLVNWANDPNGLCWYQGYYHLFYQANPYEQRWDDMYWAHAVSRDLVHWKHMPHVLEPQKDLWSDAGRKGGAFSGCAVVNEREIEFFLTRHDGPQEDGEQTREWQARAVCRDGLHVQDEQDLITDKPEGASFDFRDPKVDRIDGNLYMVLGSCLDRKPALLLYQKEEGKQKDGQNRAEDQSQKDGQDQAEDRNQKDGQNRTEDRKQGEWLYKGPLLVENTPGIRTFECPDFFKLDGRYVALGAWMCHLDEEGRRQLTRCYVGDFDGSRLDAKKQQWYDFGGDFYAVQSFVHEGRRIAIGWISDFNGEHQVLPNGTYGSFALPRELHVKDDRLFMMPVEECYGLLGDVKLQVSGQDKVEKISLPGSSYHAKIRLRGDGDFRILLAEDGEDRLTLERKAQVTGLRSTKEQVKDIHFVSDSARVREIEIFMDRRVVEVFLNGGESAGTKLFYQRTTNGCFEAEFAAGDLEELTVRTMKSIWS